MYGEEDTWWDRHVGLSIWGGLILIAGIFAALILFHNDSENLLETVCLRAHSETTVEVSGAPGALGGVPLSSNLEMVTRSVCDEEKTIHYTCEKFKPSTNWHGRRCINYRRIE